MPKLLILGDNRFNVARPLNLYILSLMEYPYQCSSSLVDDSKTPPETLA
ncbi:MAG: hypothetical protein LBL90_01170 [Prevotellaceae bacterium]|nr:hypothetical protein [Prevotellaceae bacterium]